ncbi:MAG TPA: response regulator transcription factor, partial [Bacteroidota bacterium]|nr:response regulator transcription factor [Bacteroidota bacterium]
MPRILIVDDHPLVRQGLKAGLSKAPDLKVIGEAETADEALTEARNQRPDIILLDISLPGRNGFEVLRQLHAEMPEVRILMLSTYSEKQYAVRCLRNGAWGYLTKKSSSDELIDAVRTVMQGRKYITSSLAQLLASE